MKAPIDTHNGKDFVVEPQPLECVFELQVFAPPLERALAGALPSGPGQAARQIGGKLRALHVAPGRWLVPNPEPGLLALLESASAEEGAILMDVSGKWQQLDITGPGATRVLCAAVAVESVLAERDCAALLLFDCPAILITHADGFHVWVTSTYAEAFKDLIALT